MTAVKVGMLILYIILSYVAIMFPLTFWANISFGILVLVVALHLMECVMYKDMIIEAPGAAAWHLLNIFLFGVVHMISMRVAIRDHQESVN